MQLITLGGLRLEGVDFRRRKPLLVLAYLTLEGPQERHRLSRLVFPDAHDPRSSLRVALTRLRNVAPDALHVSGTTVRSLVACDADAWLDSFLGPRLPYADDSDPGAFLAGVDVSGLGVEMEEWIYATRELLAERVRASLLALAEAASRRGDVERSARSAVRALSVSGAGAAEPEALRRAYAVLRDVDPQRAALVARELREYGIEPAPDTRGDSWSTGPPSDRSQNNLNVPLTSFVGRHDEMHEIATVLATKRDRLITLMGPAGVGKTRLSIQVAHEALLQDGFGDGVFWVGLDTLGDVEQVPEQIAADLGLSLLGTDPPLDQLVRQLRSKRMLIVLDNFEHLIHGAMIPVRLVQECPELAVIVTTRERLRVSEERIVRLEGLKHPEVDREDAAAAMAFDAVRLFTIRAQRQAASFRLDESTLPSVLRICRSVDGSPLGLELAAAWVGSLPISDVADVLEQNLHTLTSRSKDVPDKHRSLEAAFQKSWDLLDDGQRAALRRFAVFHGGFRRDAAAEVAGASLSDLADLVDKSLLRLAATGRYDLHPLVHQFCRAKLAADPDELTTITFEHGRYFRDQACAPDDRVPISSRGWRNLFDRFESDLSAETLLLAREELPNLRAAWNHYLAMGDARSVAAVVDFHAHTSEIWGRSREGRSLMEAALDVFGDEDAAQALARARVEGAVAATYWRLGLFDEGADMAERALAVLTESEPRNEPVGSWWAAQAAGLCHLHTGRIERALEALRRAHARADDGAREASGAFLRRRLDAMAGLSAAVLGTSAVVAGDLEAARGWSLEARDRMYASSPRMAAYCYYPLSALALAERDFAAALRWASDGVEHGQRVGHDVVLPDLRRSLAYALFCLERYDEAEDVLMEGVQQAERDGNIVWGTPLRATLGRTLVRLDRASEAVPLLLRALRDARAVGAVPFALDDALLGLAEIAASRGDPMAHRIARFVANLESAHASAHFDAHRMLERATDDVPPAAEDFEAIAQDITRAFGGSQPG